MPSENEMEQAAAQLESFRSEHGRHQTTLSEMLDQYTALIQDYKRLKSDYEEERDSRERYKQMSRGQERNPFVLVLIDGDGYIFEDNLISAGAEGGQRAAHLLNQAVVDSLRSRGLDHCKVMVRVYANLSGLSKALSRAKLAGPEKRSLAPFVANFNRSMELFDFIDAGDLKENADFKIRAMLRLFAENPQCKHIFFAGCHDVGYVSELSPHLGNRDRITLVRTSSFHHEFSKLGLRTEGFPNVFRFMPLDTTHHQAPPRVPFPLSAEPTLGASSNDSSTICTFYQRGNCKYGKSCRFTHSPKAANGTSSGHYPSSSNGSDWRQLGSAPREFQPFQMPMLTKTDNDFMNATSVTHEAQASAYNFEALLPKADDVPAGMIAVNNRQHRLDPYLPSPLPEWWQAFSARVTNQKLCNNFHLARSCSKGESCEYDHSPVSPAVLACLSHAARSLPCPRRGECRSLACTQGHLCQKTDCKHRGGKTFCKISASMHTVNPAVAAFVQGFVPEGGLAETSSRGHNSTPSLVDATSVTGESDESKEQGATQILDDSDDDAASLD